MSETRYARRKRDQRTADDAVEDRALTCSAHGCPGPASVRLEGAQPLCSAHQWANPHDWPRITQEQHEHMAPRRPGAAWRDVADGPLAWARRLRACELHEEAILPSGAAMTKAQRDMWRAALVHEERGGEAERLGDAAGAP